MQFIDPPQKKWRQRSPHWENVVQELKANPEEWGLAGTYSPGVATHLRQGKYPSFIPDGCGDPRRYMEEHWEVTTRKSGNRCDVYIRWIGGREA